MADFIAKTCDVCGEQGALRFTIKNVDYQIDPADGKRDYSDGNIDLCHGHCDALCSLVNRLMDKLQMLTPDRYEIWRKMFGKGSVC